ncbi:hypothetical protein, conserved [Leishmania tarentolae]|uniref:Uncharacterized protein n=1 Tax=Leishmania tarentolae TaxID=5689 RepID=A0A640KJK2_LEITA|nr:hypothetical protein, conserved [Leishmania tarentolae]
MPPRLHSIPFPEGAERAPFSYTRRVIVDDFEEGFADAEYTIRDMDLNGTLTFGHFACTRRRRIAISHMLDMTTTAHRHSSGYMHGEASAMPRRVFSHFPSLSTSPPIKNPPSPLPIDPLPSCFRPLRYARSARAWDAIAAGCVSEAKALSEADNDVVARAASCILGGDPRQGLILLESCVIATCVVLHERRRGVLTRASCVERHNAIALHWVQHRTQSHADIGRQLPYCDVNPLQVTEEEVCYVVLQSMQLIDLIEITRWYTVAFVLCTPDDAQCGSPSGGPCHKGKVSRKPKRTPLNHHCEDNVGDQSSVTLSPVGAQDWPEGKSFYDFSAASSQGLERDSAPEGVVSTAATCAASSDDGSVVPFNVWLRYFFALCETTCAERLLQTMSFRESSIASKTRNRGSISSASQGTPSKSLPRSGSTKGNGDNCHTSLLAGPLAGKRCRSVLRYRDRRGSDFPCGNPLLGRCESRTGSFYSSSFAAPRTVPVWFTAAMRPLDQEAAASLLLSHCAEWDVFFITAVTAFHTHHFRTCMMAASRFLHWAEEKGVMMDSMRTGDHRANAQRSSLPALAGVSGLQEYQVRLALLVRAWSGVQVGERLQFGKDVVALLDYAEDSLSYHVGCALALFGLPLPTAKETVMNATACFTGTVADAPPTSPHAVSAHSFSRNVQMYLYVVTESVHALTLLHLGMVEPAMRVAKTALDRAKSLKTSGNSSFCYDKDDAFLLDTLRRVVVISATALEDSASVLGVALSPHLLAYIAVCPAFFGGLCAGGIRVKAQSEVHRLVYPSNLPLYASTRQMIPFHMNRAVYLYHSRKLCGAWDDACCAVAMVDEVVGSVEFAFSDCFPLHVYYFACKVGYALLEELLLTDLEAAKASLLHSTNKEINGRKDAALQEDEILITEILHIWQDVVQRMVHFYPHSRLTELCYVQLNIVRGDRNSLRQAVILSECYPHSPAAQNLLTLALYFDHHVPEAADSAVKNLQAFPHSLEIIRMHRMLHKKNIGYRFDYRGILPTRYKPGLTKHRFTKRMALLIFLLAANVVVLCLTAYVNSSFVVDISDTMAGLAVRLQVPSPIPLFFGAIFFMHAITATLSTNNLISTILTDLFFVNSALNRALFCLRCIPLVNVINALLITFAGNGFLFESSSLTVVLYIFLGVLFIPFTTRVWFLPSVDEPKVEAMSWLAILGVDTVLALFLLVPHAILAVVEPYMSVVFYFYAPTPRPGLEAAELVPQSIRERLLLHMHYGHSMPPRFKVSSGSSFLYIRCLKWLYYRSHSSMETRYLAESQLEAEKYRVFPMSEGEEARVLFSNVSTMPLCGALTSTELNPASDTLLRGSIAVAQDKKGSAAGL